MAARTGMATVIATLRRLSNAGTADHTVAGVTYWSDEQLQAVLDRWRSEHRGVSLVALDGWEDGEQVTVDYRIPAELRDFEEPPGEEEDDPAGWLVHDGRGVEAPEYVANFAAGVITFATNTSGAAYYLDCRTYDVWAAAADVWEAKAAFAAANVDWASDNHRISASQEREHCLKQARECRAKAGGGMQVVEMWRSDEEW